MTKTESEKEGLEDIFIKVCPVSLKKISLYRVDFNEPCRFHSLVDDVERDSMHPLIAYGESNHWVKRFATLNEEEPPPFRTFIAKRTLQDIEANEFGLFDGFFISKNALKCFEGYNLTSHNVYPVAYKRKGILMDDYAYLMFNRHFRNEVNYDECIFCRTETSVERGPDGEVVGVKRELESEIRVKSFEELRNEKKQAYHRLPRGTFESKRLVYYPGSIEDLDLFTPFVLNNTMYASERFKAMVESAGLTGITFKIPYGEYFVSS